MIGRSSAYIKIYVLYSIHLLHTLCSRNNKYRKGRLIGIDNGQLTFNEKSRLINRGRGSYNIQTRLYTAVHTQLHNIYYYDVLYGAGHFKRYIIRYRWAFCATDFLSPGNPDEVSTWLHARRIHYIRCTYYNIKYNNKRAML